MAKQIWITSAKLIEILRISERELHEIEKFFDADPYDKWNLENGKDYRIINQSNGLREYTDTGAYAIASYLEHRNRSENKGFLGWIREFVRKLKGDVRKTFIKEKILYNSSSLVKRRNYFYLCEKDLISIFGTRKDYFYKIFELAQKEEKPLIVDLDYDDTFGNGMRYYSTSGILKLAKVFNRELTNKNRQEWCEDVGAVIIPFTHEIEKIHIQRNQRITSTKNAAKKRDKSRCRITKESPRDSSISPIKLAAHHLYSAAHYPHLADSVDNIITIKEEIHDHFHQVMGGKGKPCTIDDFINYIKNYYPDKLELITWLHGQKAKIPSEPLSKNAPMVLYLPPKQVMQNN